MVTKTMLGGCRIVVCSTCLSAKAAARRGKIQVEMRPFMASVAVIFGVDFTGPHILVVTSYLGNFFFSLVVSVRPTLTKQPPACPDMHGII